jgi:diketogulonate reductase-like aldo/keto reductase
VTSYAPLGGLGSKYILENMELMAIAERLSVSPARLTLAWTIRRGLSVIPKSFRLERIQDNALCLDLAEKISEHDMAQMERIFEMNYPTTISAQTSKELNLKLEIQE